MALLHEQSVEDIDFSFPGKIKGRVLEARTAFTDLRAPPFDALEGQYP